MVLLLFLLVICSPNLSLRANIPETLPILLSLESGIVSQSHLKTNADATCAISSNKRPSFLPLVGTKNFDYNTGWRCNINDSVNVKICLNTQIYWLPFPSFVPLGGGEVPLKIISM